MRIEYDRTICNGWFQCVQEWDRFEMDIEDGKANLTDADESSNGTFVCDVSADDKEAAIAAAESCPVDAITVYEEDEEVVPDG